MHESKLKKSKAFQVIIANQTRSPMAYDQQCDYESEWQLQLKLSINLNEKLAKLEAEE